MKFEICFIDPKSYTVDDVVNGQDVIEAGNQEEATRKALEIVKQYYPTAFIAESDNLIQSHGEDFTGFMYWFAAVPV